MARALVLLEDSPGRVRAVEAWLNERDDLVLVHSPRADTLIAWLEERLAEVALISLDYHLGGGGPDAGTGFDVALWLSQREPVCPVLVHTSDVTAAGYVLEVLREGGWQALASPFLAETWGASASELLTPA